MAKKDKFPKKIYIEQGAVIPPRAGDGYAGNVFTNINKLDAHVKTVGVYELVDILDVQRKVKLVSLGRKGRHE